MATKIIELVIEYVRSPCGKSAYVRGMAMLDHKDGEGSGGRGDVLLPCMAVVV